MLQPTTGLYTLLRPWCYVQFPKFLFKMDFLLTNSNIPVLASWVFTRPELVSIKWGPHELAEHAFSASLSYISNVSTVYVWDRGPLVSGYKAARVGNSNLGVGK